MRAKATRSKTDFIAKKAEMAQKEEEKKEGGTSKAADDDNFFGESFSDRFEKSE